jgi:hypothetical protein
MEKLFEGWAILELMGHRRLGGKVSEVEMFGAKMCRIDVPHATDPDKTFVSQLYGGASIYCLTPCTEEAARAVAKLSQPAPVQPWEFPQLPKSERVRGDAGMCEECGDSSCYGCEEEP